MKKLLLGLAIACVTIICYLPAWSQQKTITGTVTTARDHTPLPGVTVRVVGTNRGSTTDPDGKFKVQASEGDVLEFSFIGFQNQRVTVGERNTIGVSLLPSQASLGEVVVTAMGQEQQERKLGYAVQTISGNDIEETHRDNFTTALQGRVAGLSVTSTSGLPGASTTIRLRGVNSIGLSNSPLFIVDGVPVDNSTVSTAMLTSINNSSADYANERFDFSNRIADINPNDIESITVLKGPEATALYGIDATSGAIVITTKKGKAGKMSVDYSSILTTTKLYRYPETQEVYDKGSGGVYNPGTSYFLGPKIDPSKPRFDNIHHFFETGISQTHNLSFSGGSDKITYRLSSSYLNNQGVVPTTKLERINISLRSTARISDKLSVDGSFSYIQTDNIKAEKGPTGFMYGLLLWPRYSDVRDYLNPDGSRLMIDPDLDPDGEFENPFFAVNKNHFYDKNRRSITNVGISYDPLNWLNLSGRIGNDAYTTSGMVYYNANSIHGYSFGGRIDQYTSQQQNIYSQLMAKLHKDFGKWNTSLLLGNAYYDYKTVTNAQSGENFQVNDFVSLNVANPLSIQNLSSQVEKRLIGVFGEFNIGYEDIFNLQVTGRNDWTSTLPIGRNHFFYPSANASFAFTEIPAFAGLKNGGVLTFGKLRASIAQVGKDAPPYQVLPALLPQTTTGGGFAYNFNGPSPFLRPEQTTSHSFGTHLEFLSSRLTVDVEYYKTKSIHQIVPLIRKSYIPGFVLYTINGGSLTNHGMEVTLTGMPVKTKDLQWNIILNYAFNRSKLLSLPAGVGEFYNSDTWLAYNVRNGMMVGGPLTTFTGATWMQNNKGQILIDPGTGNPLKNSNFQIIGDRNPDFTGGLTNSIHWKNFDFSFLIDFRKGGDVYNATELAFYRRGISTRTLNRETPVVVRGVLKDGFENTAHPTVNTIQITPYNASSSGYYTTTSVESDYIEKNINWIRMRDISIYYMLPHQWFEKQHTVKSVSVGVSTSNLFIITNYLGQDPDVNGTTSATLGSGGTGMDYNAVGTPRVINFSINAHF
jgi:TonB-linked SusC/RagA family outer membrane protein